MPKRTDISSVLIIGASLFAAPTPLFAQLGMPDPADRNSYICNISYGVDLLHLVHREGADLTRVRSVGFYFYGPEAAMPAFQAELAPLGFTVVPEQARRARHVTIDVAIDEIWVRATVARLCEIGARHGVEITSISIATPERDGVVSQHLDDK